MTCQGFFSPKSIVRQVLDCLNKGVQDMETVA